ncbi:hypothetical protein [Hyphomicrobium sp.]|uniref:hypothetical protein n=1 Tax=Hyphomicrobium sp. TaxID=82 RepID=UPI002FDF8EF5
MSRNSEAHTAAIEVLKAAAKVYIEAFGPKAGIENMAEDFCRYVAERQYPEGWAGIVQHIVKVSG